MWRLDFVECLDMSKFLSETFARWFAASSCAFLDLILIAGIVRVLDVDFKWAASFILLQAIAWSFFGIVEHINKIRV